jgi:hypothetical protein
VYSALVSGLGRRLSISAAAWLLACGTAPPPREQAFGAPPAPRLLPVAAVVDPCAPVDDKPPVALATSYVGLARNARCEAELQAMMQEVSLALGVSCTYCHVPGDFPALTERKRVANWMATELIPSLRKRSGGDIACRDCHAGRAKILGDPRRRELAIEWMTLELGERFEQAGGGPLYCKTCHGADLGRPEFRSRVILSEHLPQKQPTAERLTP